MCNTLGDICKKNIKITGKWPPSGHFNFFSKFEKKCISCPPQVTLIPNIKKIHQAISEKLAYTDRQTDGRTDKTQSYIPRNPVRRGIITRKFTYTAFIHVQCTRKLKIHFKTYKDRNKYCRIYSFSKKKVKFQATVYRKINKCPRIYLCGSII